MSITSPSRIENFELEPVRAELARRGLDPKPDGAYAWSIKDPSGTTIQICAIKGVFPGAAAPTAKESDGTKNLASIPGPDGKGFKAFGVSHLVYNVAGRGSIARLLHEPSRNENRLLQAGRCVRRGCAGRADLFPEVRGELSLPPQEPASRK